MEKMSGKKLREFVIIILMIMIARKNEICECCIESERNGLLQIKSSYFDPKSPSFLSSWGTLDADCCNWERVHCNSTTGHVTELRLYGITQFDWYLNASLFLPFQQLNQLYLQDNNIAGFIHNQGFEKLSTLSNLEFLGLSSNKFNNTVLHSLSGFRSLKFLDLSRNQLNGTISISALNNLTSTLQELDLNMNQIEGFDNMEVKFDKLEYVDLSRNSFNSSIFQFLSELSSLQTLDLGYNNFKEFNNLKDLHLNSTVLFQIIGRMNSLKSLHLPECGLSGNIPASQGLCNLNHLQFLDLMLNDLNGNLPPCMANLTSLQYLDLSGNQFRGNVSVSPLRSLTSLQYLQLSGNNFQIPISLAPFVNHSQLKSLYVNYNKIYADKEDHNLSPKFQLKYLYMEGYGEGGVLPKFLYHQHNLLAVYISSINVRGSFPYWLLENNTRLGILDLSNNSVSGPIQLPTHPHMNLTFLDISGNFFSGSTPSQIGLLFPNLSYLIMSRNKLMGSIPDSMCQSTSLYFLDISKNNISGTIPKCFRNMSQLGILDLSDNSISGNLPSNFSSSFLTVVNLSKNRLHGTLDTPFYPFIQLVLLDLSHNNFSGGIPSWIEKLSQLSFLVLGNNNFQGEIPTGLCKLKQLSFLDLSHNSIHGHMLPCLNITSSWSRKQYITRIAEPLDITMKGRTYPYERQILNYISGIDMSCNNLTGYIPLGIEDLRNIKVLNLSHNMLIGTIPTALSNLKEIESLDLSFNFLQGIIPPQLTQLTSLVAFNVSYNNLSGQTPNQVAQFATFDDSSYRGNPYLCGWPLPRSCSATNTPPSNESTSLYDDERSNIFIDMEIFYVSFGVTYVMVLLAIVTALWINSYWRRIWFYYVQISIDKTRYSIIDNVFPLFSSF